MKPTIFAFILICLIACNTSKQTKQMTAAESAILKKQQEAKVLLFQKIKESDSVLLISHLDTDSIGANNQRAGTDRLFPFVLLKNKLNTSIIIEQKKIENNIIDTLVSVLSMTFHEENESYALKCFSPRHTIVLFKKDTTSYLDICFHCRGYEASEDLRKVETLHEPFDNKKWDALSRFFKKNGFTYQLK